MKIISNLIIGEELDRNNELFIAIARCSIVSHLKEDEALTLICHLLDTFQLSTENVEFHFVEKYPSE